MARMYSGKRGKSGSTKPVRKTPPSWLKYKPFEVEKLVVKLAKEGKSSAQIGIILRDSYGIPSVHAVTGKKIYEIMTENKVTKDLPEDLRNLIKIVIETNKHVLKNKKDQSAKRGMRLTESKIGRLIKYYKRKGVIPETWEYTREQAKFLLRE
ncbi:MAG: 30S ribosomal protein S15 [Candidatus Nanoarchaeia archaeon]|nr:30S ribosomal protein S15 [Candidatus Nanoarchaeia archaeon]MDD5239458.1 30S ribosomal protein S15 [Candidatus Nanoarchaeia archaeon]